MLALYRGGRQSEALEVYGDLRELLVEELGLEPAPALRELQAAILRQDPALGAVPGPPEAPAPMRKPVTVLCAELRVAPVAGVDPKALDVVQARALPALTSALERHGGKLAATAGDRFLGVFGVAALHEDDACARPRPPWRPAKRSPPRQTPSSGRVPRGWWRASAWPPGRRWWAVPDRPGSRATP
jgi:class 3 adenylate cyclase